MKKIITFATVGVAVLTLASCSSNTWQDQTRTIMEEEVGGMTETEVVEACNSLSYLDVEEPQDVVDLAAGFGGGELNLDAILGDVENVDPERLRNVVPDDAEGTEVFLIASEVLFDKCGR